MHIAVDPAGVTVAIVTVWHICHNLMTLPNLSSRIIIIALK